MTYIEANFIGLLDDANIQKNDNIRYLTFKKTEEEKSKVMIFFNMILHQNLQLMVKIILKLLKK